MTLPTEDKCGQRRIEPPKTELVTWLVLDAVSCTRPLQHVRMPDNQMGVSDELDLLSQRISFQDLVCAAYN